ncbi:MAG: viologen exporter family transport system permease protein [Mycobacteriales bacterium]
MPVGSASLRVGAALAGAGFRRYASYRQATVAGAFTNTVFGVIKLFILLAVARQAGGAVAGYDAAALSTYTWAAQGLISAVWLFAWTPIATRVRTGDVAIDLARPAHPVAVWLAEDLGRAGQAALFRFAVPMVIGGLIFGLRLPTRWPTVPLFVLSSALAVVISFGCRLLVNLAAFWLLDVRGAVTLYVVANNVLSGLLVPVAFFPGWAERAAYMTPFPWMLQVPTDLLVERRVGAGALGAVAAQAGWAAALLALATWTLARGTRRLVVQGG